MRKLPEVLILPVVATALGGCASLWAMKDSVSDVHPVVLADGRMQVQMRSCVDRTGNPRRDLGREATDAFAEKLRLATEFEMIANGRYVLNCDISGFAEGSAFKRWLMPGWGATTAQVAVMITDAMTGETVGIARGTANVAGGGLYTLGADKVILGVALDDVVRQLRKMVAESSTRK
ncbi:conserved protein of unknown function [Burkholderia multivorans]